MVRLLFGLIGVILALLPDETLRLYEFIAFRNPEECRPNPWLRTMIQGEGILFAFTSVIGGKWFLRMMNVTGIAGILALLFPERYLEFGAKLSYDNADEVQWRPGSATVSRVIGAIYLLLVMMAYRNHNAKEEN